MAYQKPCAIWEDDDGSSWKGLDSYLIIPKGEENLLKENPIDFSHGDEVYIDEKGNIYYNKHTDDQERSICKHVYEAVTSYQHTKYSDGSCTIVAFDSKRCTKCGDLIKGEEILTTTYKRCPH